MLKHKQTLTQKSDITSYLALLQMGFTNIFIAKNIKSFLLLSFHPYLFTGGLFSVALSVIYLTANAKPLACIFVFLKFRLSSICKKIAKPRNPTMFLYIQFFSKASKIKSK
jgi:hypothetical protein